MKAVIVIPAYNEEKIIQDTALSVVEAARKIDPHAIDIALVDNSSTDATAAIMRSLAQEYKMIRYYSEPQQGKGSAVLNTWRRLKDEYDVFIFMDADLATSLTSLPELIQSIKEGNDIVVGSRYHPDSRVSREKRRKTASVLYHALARRMLNTSVTDFPCGFKAVSKAVVRDIAPRVEDRAWFFDTELLFLAEQCGLTIREIPVEWSEPRTSENASRLSLPSVGWQYIQGLRRLGKLKKRP